MPTYAELVNPMAPRGVAQVTPPAPMTPMPMEPVEPPMDESPMLKLEKLNMVDIIDFLKAKSILPEDFTAPVPVEPIPSSEPSFDEILATPPVQVSGAT